VLHGSVQTIAVDAIERQLLDQALTERPVSSILFTMLGARLGLQG
jgi:hypothetical protein